MADSIITKALLITALIGIPCLGMQANDIPKTTVYPTHSSVVMKVIQNDMLGTELLYNTGFEEISKDAASLWQPWQTGFILADSGRTGSRSIMCENMNSKEEFGTRMELQIDQTMPVPIVVSGWSKAENVNGSPDPGYSLYVDIVYQDGTPLWGRTSNFRCGTHDWERQELVILPEKPVKQIYLYCLFRGHTGKVWFDDISVRQLQPQDGAVLLDNSPMRIVKQTPGATKSQKFSTKDGLSLALSGNSITSIRLAGHEVSSGTPSGFLVRDIAADSDIYSFDASGIAKQGLLEGTCRDLGLKLHAEFTPKSNCIFVRGRITDMTGKDRAITLHFALPVNATGWQWDDDIRHSRHIDRKSGTQLTTTNPINCGATGTMSTYPVASIHDDLSGIALAMDMNKAAVSRLSYHSGTRQLIISYDFGLVPETGRFSGGAEFAFVIYRIDPKWGFRSAMNKLTRIFPDYFTVRSKDQGIWMPFTDVSTVQDWQDFGFRYHEGDNNPAFDNANGILPFRYTEPMTWWMPMEQGTPRTPAEAAHIRDEYLNGSEGFYKTMAHATLSSAMTDPDGNSLMQFIDAPWTDGAVWSLNPCPYLPGESTEAKTVWNSTVKEKGYGKESKSPLAGEYLDSIEGYVTSDLNFNREHFRYTSVPLTFSTDTKQPALFKGLAVYELTKWMADDLHHMGRLTFANGIPYRFPFLCPWLDIMGTETNWLYEGKYSPAQDATMSLWRTMSGAKPYLLLQNTNFDAFTPDLVERYFQRCMFYGMFPSMFSNDAASNPYWENPKWYNRDRPLFKKYIPLIKQIAEAGWRPITLARSTNPSIYIERFGPDEKGTTYLTLMNDTDKPQSGDIALDKALVISMVRLHELVTGTKMRVDKGPIQIKLQAQEVKVIYISR